MKILIVVITSLLFLQGAWASTAECKIFYGYRPIPPGPIPEFLPQDTILLTVFDFNRYTQTAHSRIISDLPNETNALIFLPEFKDSSWYSTMVEGYKEYLRSTVPNYDSLLASAKIEFVTTPESKDFNSSDHGNWTRDFMSQLILDNSGKIKFLNLKYHRDAADVTDSWIQNFIIQRYQKKLNYTIGRLDVPFYFEWGNFTTDGNGHFFVSEKVFDINRRKKINLSKKHVNTWIKNEFGKKSKIVWVKPLKHEKTGHVDMFMKFLDSKRVLVSKSDHLDWKADLDQKAELLTQLGYEVTRLDIALEDSEFLSFATPLRSYTNSLIVGSTAYVPKYDSINTKFGEHDRRARSVYKKLGYKVISIDSSESICSGGALHCLTSTIPNIEVLLK